MKHIRTNRKIQTLLFLILLLVSGIIFNITKLTIIFGVLNISIMLLTILTCKFSFFSLQALLMNYPLLTVTCQYFGGFSYGLLQRSKIPVHYLEINIIILIYNVIFFLFLINFDIVKQEVECFQQPVEITKFTAFIFSSLAIVLVIIAFPYGFFDLSVRYQGLIAGRGWGLLSILVLFFSFPHLKDMISVKIAYLFVTVWFLGHGERVELLGLLTTIGLLLLNKNKKAIKLATIIKAMLLILLCVILFLIIGKARQQIEITVSDILYQLIIQPTMADIMYVFNTGIEYVDIYGILKGTTLITYLLELIPFIDVNTSITHFLNHYYYNAGGGFILTEPYVNYSYIGVAIYSLLVIFWLRFCLKGKSQYKYYCYCATIILSYRVCWYGLVYFVKLPILYIPALMLLAKFLSQLSIKRR